MAGHCVHWNITPTGPAVEGLGDVPLPVLIRHISTPSRPLIEATVLHAAVDAQMSRHPSLLIVHLSRLPADDGAHLTELLTAVHLERYPFVLLADADPHLVHLGIRQLVHLRDEQPAAAAMSRARRCRERGDIGFTPAQRWIMRALVQAPLARLGWWEGPSGPWRTAQALAHAGRMSLATATRCVNALMARGWVEKTRHGFAVIDPPGMLRACADHARLHRPAWMPMQIAYGAPQSASPSSLLGWMRATLTSSRPTQATGTTVTLTGWHALAVHRMAVSGGLAAKPMQVAVAGDLMQLMQACHLVPASAASAGLQLLPVQGMADASAAPASGTVDPVQAMLDIAGDPENGPEQVTEVIRQVETALKAASP